MNCTAPPAFQSTPQPAPSPHAGASHRQPVRAGRFVGAAPVVASLLLVAGCGGGSSTEDAGQGPFDARIAAARTTASANAECVRIQPFYWEIGDASARIHGESVNGSGTSGYRSDSVMAIASASKWLYAAYVAQVRGGALTDSDVQHLGFRAGYSEFSSCALAGTVGGCLSIGDNGVQNPADVGFFAYGGGHMQNHAARVLGLDTLGSNELAAELRSRLGTEIALDFGQPQPAGGVNTSAAEYAKFLRKLLSGSLALGSRLGANAVCTNPSTCSSARNAPTPPGESWSYSLGHWIENDPAVGDGAYSSPGLFGFYPWIDSSRRWYGVVARVDLAGAVDSAQCGRLIRRAWVTSTPQ